MGPRIGIEPIIAIYKIAVMSHLTSKAYGQGRKSRTSVTRFQAEHNSRYTTP